MSPLASVAFVQHLPLFQHQRNCNVSFQTSHPSLLTPLIRRRPTTPRRQRSFAPKCAQSTSSPTQDWPLGPPDAPARLQPREWFRGLRDDIARRRPLYLSDWTDGLKFKSIPAILYLYFACLAPVVAFGGLTSSLTAGSMGVVEFLLSSGSMGMLYALISGQPLTFISPTGLTLAFTAALFGFCRVASLPFMVTYAWCGIWTAALLFLAAISNFSDLIKFCTRFTDDIFNSLIATNFLYEAVRSLIGGFLLVGADKTKPFTALALAIGTFLMGRFFSGLRSSRYLVERLRNLLADFGPVLSIALMSGIASIPAVAKIGLQKLSIPSKFALAGNRALFIPLFSAPVSVIFASFVPAILLTCLFFLDQNISVRVVNSPVHRLKKGPGYHMDIMVLAICTFVCSIMGLPLMCAGTVQSLAHVQALSTVEKRNGKEVITSVQENRLTAFFVHFGILSSLFLLPIVKRVPMAVVNGLFLYLGRNMMNGNDFLSRIRYLFMDPKLYPDDSPMKTLPARQVHSFTTLQIACLTTLWMLKLNKKTSMFFPSVIATLMFIRSRIAPKFWQPKTLELLDGELFKSVESEQDDTHTAHSHSPPTPVTSST